MGGVEEVGLTYSSGRGRWVIAATVLGSGMAALDATVVGIALPTIGREFRAPMGSLQWVVSGYTLTLAGWLLLGGSLGDRLGRRRIFSIGVAWFAIASAACGIAPNVDVLIVTRALQGVGGALLTPGSLAILQASFASGDRSRAIGAWSGLGGLATAAGPLVGGELISAGSWRWIFYLNVPLSLVVLAVASRHVPETRDPAVTGRLDVAGAISGVVMLGGVTFALIEGATLGWTSGDVLGALAVGIAGFAAFALAERRATAPMLPLALFGDRQFAATNAVTFAVYAALSGALFLLPVQLQIVSGYSPVASGLALLPVTAIMLVASARSGKLAARIGPRLQMSVGPLVVAGGLALLVRATDGAGYITFVLPAVVVFGVGLAITVAPLTATAMSSAPVAHAGTASAINNDVARIAGLVAVAALPVLAGITGASYLHPAELSAGFRSATLISAGLCASGGLVAAVAIVNPPRTTRTPAPSESDPVTGAEAREPVPVRFCGLEAPPMRAHE